MIESNGYTKEENMAERVELFHQGNLTDGWHLFGAHPVQENGVDGWRFTVWAPNAQAVSVVGPFNDWNGYVNVMERQGQLWTTFIPHLETYTEYKYAVTGVDGKTRMKADPYGFHTETRPGTASKLYDINGFSWKDDKFRANKKPVYDQPLNIYEVHLGSWRKRENG